MAYDDKSKFSADDVQFEEPDAFNPQGTGGIKEIMLSAFSRCINEGSKEMTRGGMSVRNMDGQIIQVMRPDQVQIFCNSIDMFLIAAAPKLEENKQFYDRILNVQNKLNDIEAEKNKLHNELYADFNSKHGDFKKRFQDEFQRKLLDITNAAELKTLGCYKEILKHLSCLLNELKYFGEEGVWA